MLSWKEVHDYSDFLRPTDGEVATVTPMHFTPVIHLDAAGKRVSSPMRWGFTDRRSKTPLDRPKHMHARSETIDTLPTFADAFAFARGFVVVNTFNEGEELPNGKTKQWTITPRDGKPISIAVIFERWTNPESEDLLTFVMVTTPANKLISRITDRIPAIIQPEQWAMWLGETPTPLGEIKAMLQPFEGDWDMAEQAKPQKPASTKKPGPQLGLF